MAPFWGALEKLSRDYGTFKAKEAIEDVEKKVIVVDCRRPDEYAVSKIPGAENIFFKCEDNEILEGLESNGLNEQTHLIINYCSLGYRSAIMTNRIKEALSTNPSLNQGMNFFKFHYLRILVFSFFFSKYISIKVHIPYFRE